MQSFKETYEAFVAYKESSWAEMMAYQESYFADLKAFWKARHKGKRFDATKATAHPDYPAFRAPYDAKADSMIAARQAEIARFENELRTLAPTTPIPATESMIRGHWVYGGTYASQGFGAIKYTRGAAMNYALKADFYGVKAEVRPCGDEIRCHGGGAIQDFEVMVATDELGVAILEYLAPVPLRDWVASCWKRGVNPRVFNPFLPHGIEEKLGVDYHGNLKEVAA